MLDIEEFKKKLDKKSRLMGIDPGRKRIGICLLYTSDAADDA